MAGDRQPTTDKSVIGVEGVGRLVLHWDLLLTPTKVQAGTWFTDKPQLTRASLELGGWFYTGSSGTLLTSTKVQSNWWGGL